jgi:hypothetical protein
MASHPQAKAMVKNVYEVRTDITRLAGCMPREIGERQEWVKIVEKAEAGRVSLCGTLEGETLFSALYRVHMLAFMELKAVNKITEKYKEKGKENAVTTPNPKKVTRSQKGGGEIPLKATGRTRPRNKAQLDLGGKDNTTTSSTINQKILLFSPEEPIDGRSLTDRG